MNQQLSKQSLITTLSLTVTVGIVSFFLFTGCSSDSNPADDNQNPSRVAVPLEGALTNIELQANQTTQLMVSLHMPPSVGMIQSGSIDMVATMQGMTATNFVSVNNLQNLAKSLVTQDAGTVSARVGGDAATVCQVGQLYGPYTLAEVDESPIVETVGFDESSIQVLNSGPVVICMELLPAFDATVTINEVFFDIEQEDCGDPVDFSGTWSGTYSCGNSCGSSFGDEITLTIFQDGASAYYVDDGGYRYDGVVCGNIFRFERIDSDEIERGSLMLDDANHATKRSTWREQSDPYCEGDCIDILTRVTR